MCFSLSACGKKNKATRLDSPAVTISSEGVAQWKEIEHASGYAYRVDNGDEISTDQTSVTLTEGQSIVVKAVGDGKAYLDSGWSQIKTYTKPSPSAPKTLSTPVVAISADGMAHWSKITGALMYAYKVNDGPEQETTTLYVALNDGDSIVVKAVGDGTNYYDSAWSAKKTYDAQYFEPVTLDTPVVSVSKTGRASWEKVTGANSYAYIINGSEQKITTNLFVQLEKFGDRIKVQAFGDPNYYNPSAWSDEAEYVNDSTPPSEPQTLDAPVLSVDGNGLATWTAVDNAEMYTFLKNGTVEGSTSGLELPLERGETLKVKAVGDGEQYLDSDWSNEVKYEPTVSAPATLTAPDVFVAKDGTASWTENANASGFIVKIDGTEKPQQSANTYSLNNGECIEVMAVGNGTTYLNSAYSEAITYTAPGGKLSAPANIRIEIEGTKANTVLVSWDPVDRANEYCYTAGDRLPVNVDANSKVEMELKDGEIFKIFTVGVENVIIPGDYSLCVEDSDAVQVTFSVDNSKIYTVSQIIPVANYYGDVPSAKDFIVRGTVAANSAYSTQDKNISITLKEGDLTFVLYGAQFANGEGASLDTDELKGLTAISTGRVVNREGTPAFNEGNTITVTGDSDVIFALASRELGLNEIYRKDFTLPVAGFGVEITGWTAQTADTENGDALTPSEAEGVWKATVVRKTVDVQFKLTARLSFGGKTMDAEFTVTVKAFVIAPSVLDGLLSFATENNRVSQDVYSQVWQQNGIKFTNAKTELSDAVAGYVNPVRCYQWSSIKVEYTDMVKIIFTCSNATYANSLFSSIEDYVVTVDGNTVTVELGEKLNSFEIAELAKQVRINSIDVYVAKEAKALAVPEVGTIDLYGNVTWNTVANASGYEYSVNDGEPSFVREPITVTLSDGQTIKVRAVGDGTAYTYSAWSEAKTYTKQVQNLTALPQISVDEITGKVTLTAVVDHATKYVYQIKTSGGDWQTAVEISASSIDKIPYTVVSSLNGGDSIRIRAVGDEIYVFPADSWTQITYTAPDKPVELQQPDVTVDRAGKVEWSHSNDFVTKFKYCIGENLTADSLKDLSADAWSTAESGTIILDSGKSIAVIACSYSENTLDSKATIVSYFAPGTHDAVELVEVLHADDENGKPRALIYWVYDGEGVTFEIVLTNEDGSENKLTTQGDSAVIELKNYNEIIIRVARTEGGPVFPDFDYRNFKNASADLSVLDDYIAYFDGVKVATEKASLKFPEKVKENTEIGLPARGTTYSDVELEWEATDDYGCAEIVEGKLAIDVSKAPDEGTVVELYVIIFVNSTDDDATFEIKVKVIRETTFNFITIYSDVTSGSKDISGITHEQDGATVVFEKKSGETTPQYYNNGTAVRVYQNNTVTVSADCNIKQIEVTSTDTPLMTANVDTGSYSGGIWKCSADSKTKTVVFTVTGNTRVSEMKITFDIPLTDEQVIAKTKETLTQPVPVITASTYTYNLLLTSEFGASIVWSVSSSSGNGVYAYTDTTGILVVTRQEDNEISVKVSATISFGNATPDTSLTYTLTVPAVDAVNPSEKTWQKVNDITKINGILSGVVAELSIIITNSSDTKALGTYAGGNNVPAVNFNKNEISDSVALKLVKGNKTNTYAIKQGDSYLYAASSGSNYLKTQTALDDNASWSISVTSAGVATIVAQGTNTRNTMQYNSQNNSSLFACYASASQSDVSIWVYA